MSELEVFVESKRGRPGTLEITFVRPLGQEDLQDVLEPPPTPVYSVAKLRDSHHALARVLAEGCTAIEASAITGYNPQTIGQLRKDPSFQELVSHYQSTEGNATLDYRNRLRTLGLTAMGELQSRFDEKAETISTREVREIMKDTFLLANPGAGQLTPASGVTINIGFVEPPKPVDRSKVVDLEVEGE